MEELIIGFDLCDSYSQIAVYNEETNDADIFSFGDGIDEIPTTICKNRRKDEWTIGESACEMALLGTGIVVDKLLRLVKKEGTATLEGHTFQAKELMQIYLQKSLEAVKEQYGKPIGRVVFTVRDLDTVLMDAIMENMENLGYPREAVTILSHPEGYLYYLLKQSPDTYANTAVALDLSKEGLCYYECTILRGVTPQIAQVAKAELEDGFSLDILESVQGQKLADNILQACVERQFGRKIITSVFLAGRGMKDIQAWGQKTLPKICLRRKVFLETALFAKGAVWMGVSEVYPEVVSYPYCMIGAGRILATVSLPMQVGGVPKSLILLSAGDRWYSANSSVEFLLDGADTLELEVLPAGTKKPFTKKISLGELPNRPNRTTRVHLDAAFTSETALKITLIDQGFGELFPSTDQVIVREMSL